MIVSRASTDLCVAVREPWHLVAELEPAEVPLVVRAVVTPTMCVTFSAPVSRKDWRFPCKLPKNGADISKRIIAIGVGWSHFFRVPLLFLSAL